MMADDISEDEARLERALRAQERLGWIISALAVLLTAGFMVALTLDWPLLARSLFGHAVTGFAVVAMGLLSLFIAAIALFSAVANRNDALRRAVTKGDR
ncbi:hypothetical protein HY78_16085 [Rhizorhabdus wittichii DC-6]|jgi:hypothetical protein|nr:DUF485 domain-containing protein [Rhizorhabdus wittichii]ARR54848.1 hypothetical protein HY78_16085 [Rhizorhabdus wittichii DC-6]QTH21314.1 DUF485 domain-containing protein [Rhizorhabdus wittichii]